MDFVSMGVVARENLCMGMEPMRLVKLSMADVRLVVVLVFRCSRLVLLRNKEVLVEEEGLCSGL